jgi:general secretion pathway protein A
LDKQVKTAVLFNSFLTEDDLLESILLDFGFPSKGKTRKERIDALNRYLIHLLSRGENAVLMIDEAQNLSIAVLEQIRMLSNLETEKEKLLQIVLLGQLELEKKLQSPEMKQLNQRIALRLRLHPLTRVEMERYIYQRLSVAGGGGNVSFSKPAFNEIYKFTGGTPRLINLLCERILLAGFVEPTYHLDKRIVKKAEQSLLPGETEPAPSFLRAPWKQFTLLRAASLMVFLILVTVMTLSSASLQMTKNLIWERIQSLQYQILGPLPSASAKIALDKTPDSPQEAEERRNSEGVQEENAE